MGFVFQTTKKGLVREVYLFLAYFRAKKGMAAGLKSGFKEYHAPLQMFKLERRSSDQAHFNYF